MKCLAHIKKKKTDKLGCLLQYGVGGSSKFLLTLHSSNIDFEFLKKRFFTRILHLRGGHFHFAPSGRFLLDGSLCSDPVDRGFVLVVFLDKS